MAASIFTNYDSLQGVTPYPERITANRKEIDQDSLNNFIKNIQWFNSSLYGKNLSAAELFESAPNGLEFNDIVNIIFEKSRVTNLIILLDTFLQIHPTFTLSPFDKIRRAIVEDEQNLLNNTSISDRLKEQGVEINEAMITACSDLAYRINRPNIYRLSQTPVLVSDYTINFLWVNLNPQDRVKDVAQNIFKNGLDLSENSECIKDLGALRALEKMEQSLQGDALESLEKIKKSFIYRISKWADMNPNAQINLWYDSALVTQKAQHGTFEMVKAISQSRGVDLRLRDIRQLPNINGEIENALHPGAHVYFRVDLLKALIADYMNYSPKESAKYCVVTDIDVAPMAPEQLFDQRTLDYLSSNGYVFNHNGLFGFENSFFIFNKEIENACEIHNNTIIKETANTIKSLRESPMGTTFRPQFVLDAQFIFRQYGQFRNKMMETETDPPRKVVCCPESQFLFGDTFSDSEPQAEKFRFIGDSNIPYTQNGRNYSKDGTESQIKELISWKAEPLTRT